MTTARLRWTRPDGLPVYGYEPHPSRPSVDVVSFEDAIDAGAAPPTDLHTHEFFVIAYFERSGGTLRFGAGEWAVRAGDVHLIAPGDAVGVGADHDGLRAARGHAVSFTPGVVDAASSALLTWHTHPLLFPFAEPAASAPRCWTVPQEEQADWTAYFDTIDTELVARQPGHREAVSAALTLLLVRVVRLVGSSATYPSPHPDGLVTHVLTFIDEHYNERISLRDVAGAVHLSPGHLTTVIGRRTGRTVQEWITHRRLTEACRLLASTDLAVEAVAHQTGFRDPSYFARMFRRAHGSSPLDWRRAFRTT